MDQSKSNDKSKRRWRNGQKDEERVEQMKAMCTGLLEEKEEKGMCK